MAMERRKSSPNLDNQAASTESIHSTHVAQNYEPEMRLTLRERLKQKRQSESASSAGNEGPTHYNPTKLFEQEQEDSEQVIKAPSLPEKLTPEDKFQNIKVHIIDIVTSTLQGRDREIFTYLLEKMSVDEIAKRLHLSPKHTERLLSNLRKKIENEIFAEVGFYPLTHYRNDPSIRYDTLQNAAVQKRLLTLFFYNRYYTNDYAVSHYKSTRKTALPERYKGKIIASLHASLSYADYALFKSSPEFSSRIIFINGVMCAYQSDIDQFLEKNTPKEDEHLLTDIVTNRNKQIKIRKKFRTNKIPGSRKRGRIYITEEILDFKDNDSQSEE